MDQTPSTATRVLVTGAGGMLAAALVPVLDRAGFALTTTDLDVREATPWGPGGPIVEALDVRDTDAVRRAVDRVRPDVVLNLAAETDMEVCERDHRHAVRVNTDAVRTVARCCRDEGLRMIHIGTAGVFDGRQDEPYTEADPPRPINWYGATKARGEEHVAALVDDHYIVRAGWMVGGPHGKDKKFVGSIIAQLRAGRRTIEAVGDKFGSPTYAPDFATTLVPMLRGELPRGLYHAVSEVRRSRYQVACEIVELLGRTDVEVREVDSARFAGDFFAPRPRSEVLRNANLRAASANRARPWRDQLRERLAPWTDELRAAAPVPETTAVPGRL